MARDGFRIFDSDTHVGPDARILAGYLGEAEKNFTERRATSCSPPPRAPRCSVRN
jgi:hypothetical protein